MTKPSMILFAICLCVKLSAQNFCIEIREVKSGERKTAKASWWQPDKNDATEALQNAINSGVKTLVVDNIGYEWLVKPIKLASNQEIVFASGVTVRALPGAYHNQRDYMFSAKHKQNIIMRGEGNVVLRMNREDYQNTQKYKWSEWRHLLNFQSCENITIKNLTIQESGGDGIYIGRDFSRKRLPGCRNVTIQNVICKNHNRQGISIIGVENFLVKNCTFKNTKGTPPQAGIDFEPNRPHEVLKNCVIENTEFYGNYGKGADFHLVKLNQQSEPISIKFKNCSFTNNKDYGIGITSFSRKTGGYPSGKIEFINCKFKDNKPGQISIYGQPEKGLKIAFKDCTIANKNYAPSIKLYNLSNQEMGNIDFGNLKIIDHSQSEPITFISANGYGIKSLEGTIFRYSDSGEKVKFDLNKYCQEHSTNMDIITFKPATKLPTYDKNKDHVSKPLNFRHKVKFLQYADNGEQVTVTINASQIRKCPLDIIKVTIKHPEGKIIDVLKINGETTNYTLSGTKTGYYSFDIDTKGHIVNITSSSPNHAYATIPSVSLFRCNGTMYFNVPAGVETVKVRVEGSLGETVDAALINENGNVMAEVHKLEGAYVLKAKRSDASKRAIWSIKFTNAIEDYNFILGEPLSPLTHISKSNITNME